MNNMSYLKIVCCALLLFASSFQLKGQVDGNSANRSGYVSVGQRSTLSLFSDGESPYALGLGGQFRVQLAKRLNTEWFFDYLPASGQLVRRNDFHIGWSVMYSIVEPDQKILEPFVIAGHCFDYTYRQEIANPTNFANRWSSAVQAGIGTHFHLTDRLMVSISSQYMMHLGTHVHEDIHGSDVHFHVEKGGSLEGHLLNTLSFNYTLADLWKK